MSSVQGDGNARMEGPRYTLHVAWVGVRRAEAVPAASATKCVPIKVVSCGRRFGEFDALRLMWSVRRTLVRSADNLMTSESELQTQRTECCRDLRMGEGRFQHHLSGTHLRPPSTLHWCAPRLAVQLVVVFRPLCRSMCSTPSAPGRDV